MFQNYTIKRQSLFISDFSYERVTRVSQKFEMLKGYNLNKF